MKHLILSILFLALVRPVHGISIKTTITVKSKYAVNSKTVSQPIKWVRIASYQETNDLWTEFVKKATKIAEKEDYPLSVILGQAALESARGTSQYAQTRYNFFGIGAYDDNPDEAFSFQGLEKGIRGYIDLIKTNQRYRKAWLSRHDPHQMIQRIWEAGYASDPDYVGKVTSLEEFKDNL